MVGTVIVDIVDSCQFLQDLVIRCQNWGISSHFVQDVLRSLIQLGKSFAGKTILVWQVFAHIRLVDCGENKYVTKLPRLADQYCIGRHEWISLRVQCSKYVRDNKSSLSLAVVTVVRFVLIGTDTIECNCALDGTLDATFDNCESLYIFNAQVQQAAGSGIAVR